MIEQQQEINKATGGQSELTELLGQNTKKEIGDYLITLTHDEKKTQSAQLLIDAYFEISKLNKVLESALSTINDDSKRRILEKRGITFKDA